MAIFPLNVSTDTNLYVAVNNVSTVLTDNPLTAGAVTVNVSSTATFPASGIITINLEAIFYAAKTATSFTGCIRGFDGTVAATHSVGTSVFHDIPAAHHNVLKDEIKAIEQNLSDRFGLGTRISKQIIIGTDYIANFVGTPTTGGTLAPNTYYYKVFPFNVNGYIGVPSDEIVVVVGGPNNKVNFTWSSSPEVVSYRLQRGTDQGGGAGYFDVIGTSFSDSGQAFDSGANPVQAVNQFKIELPGTLDLVASQGAIRWRDYITPNVVTGSISCTSAGEMEFFTTNGVVSGMYLFGKQGDGHPIHLDVRFSTPFINFNSSLGELKCGGVTGLTLLPAGTPTGAQTPNGLGISNGTVSLPGLYFINDTDTGWYRGAANQMALTLGGIQSTIFDSGVVQALVRSAASPTFSWITDPDSGMYNIAGNQIGFSTGGTLRFDISTTALTSTLAFHNQNGSASAPSYTWASDPDTGMFRINANEIQFTAGGSTIFQIEVNDVQIIDGTAAVPAYSYINDSDTGTYRVGTNTWGVSTGGTLRFSVDTANLTSTLIYIGPDGSVGSPAVAFSADGDNGIYRIGTNNWALSAGGVKVVDLQSTIVDVPVTFKAKGTATNDSPATGYIGEVVSSSATFTNFPTSGQYGDLTSISLTAGDWLISVQLIQIQNGATVSTVTSGVSTTSGNSSTGLTDGDTQTSAVPQNAAAGAAFVGIMPKRFSLSATTTVYLKYNSSYTVATPQAAGRITAVRIR